MPRVSLPSMLKSLKTYDVILTQTTEDQLWSHFVSAFELFQKTNQKYKDSMNHALGIFFDGNPYTDHNWKKGLPVREYKEPFINWIFNTDAEAKEYFAYDRLKQDLEHCIHCFKWDEYGMPGNIYHAEVFEMLYELNLFRESLESDEKTLKQLEEINFFKAKKSFEENNKEWIVEQNLIKEHKSHYSNEYWINLFATDEDAVKFYGGVMPLTDETCKYCIARVIRDNKTKEYERIQREKLNLQTRAYNMQLYGDPLESESEDEVHTCEDCQYSTKSKSNMNIHKESNDHKKIIKQKAWYCQTCETQMRTQLEYNNHMQTSKHLKKAEGIPNLECEKCNYKTLLPHLFKQHCETKKHIELIK